MFMSAFARHDKPRLASPSTPGLSVLRLSASVRLAGVGVIIAGIWAAVAWAWS
jgi:hypothetical protein